MRTITFALFFSLVLSGCATTNQYGNFVKNPASIDQKLVANDAVQQLVMLYPPAKTRFDLQQPTPDSFGQAFVHALRTKGYSLLEFDPQAHIQTTAPFPNSGSNFPLRYIFDQASGMDVYRVTIIVGSQSITRPYVEHAGATVPAGYWSRKE